MLEDDFLREKQNIREKMLRYSRAINQGKPLDEEFREEFSSDDILKRRFNNKKRFSFDDFGKLENPRSPGSVHLKEDLINVKLEEKQGLVPKILSGLSKKKRKKRGEKPEREISGIAGFPSKENTQGVFEKKIFKESEDMGKKREHSKVSLKGEGIEQDGGKTQTLRGHPQEKKLELKTRAKSNKSAKNPNLKKNRESSKIVSEDNEKAKNTLLEGYSNATEEDKNLSFTHLLFAVLLVSFSLFLFAPQIYIRNQIYYLSREIGALRAEETVLHEESRDLKRKLENMRFQNQILDYLE